MDQRSLFFFLSGLLMGSQNLSASPPSQDKTKSAGNSKVRESVVQKKAGKDRQLPMDQALDNVRMLASRFQEYRDTTIAGRSLATLASVVCKCDKSLAPVFYYQALDLVESRLRSEELPQEKQRLWFARSTILASAAQCDGELAVQMNRDTRSKEPAKLWADLQMAHTILGADPQKASQIAWQVSGQVMDLSNIQLLNFNSLLLELRKNNPSKADQLYISMLGMLREIPATALRAVNALGNYVFGPVGGEHSDAVAVMPLDEQNENNVYVFQTQRDGASPIAVNAYLDTVSQVLLTAPTNSQGEVGVAYASSQQLVQLSKEFSPDLTPAYEVASQRLSGSFADPSLRSKILQGVSATSSDYLKLEEDELEKTLDPRRKDEIRLNLYSSHWADKDLSKVIAIAGAIQDKALKAQLRSLMDFRKAQLALENGDAEQAQAIAGHLSSPLHQTLVFLGTAYGYRQAKQSELAAAALDLATREVEKTDPKERPYLLASASTLIASLDNEWGLRTLEDSITWFNRLDKESDASKDKKKEKTAESIHASGSGFVEFARFENVQRHFDLRIKGLSFDLLDAMHALRFSPPESLNAAIFTLSNENRQGPALAAVAEAYLEQARSSIESAN